MKHTPYNADQAHRWPSPRLDRFVIWSISFYQRHLSPWKGFRCAHRVLHGGESCSQFLRRVVEEAGTWPAIVRARSRFAECRSASMALAAQAGDSAGEEDQPSVNEPRPGNYNMGRPAGPPRYHPCDFGIGATACVAGQCCCGGFDD